MFYNRVCLRVCISVFMPTSVECWQSVVSAQQLGPGVSAKKNTWWIFDATLYSDFNGIAHLTWKQMFCNPLKSLWLGHQWRESGREDWQMGADSTLLCVVTGQLDDRYKWLKWVSSVGGRARGDEHRHLRGTLTQPAPPCQEELGE